MSEIKKRILLLVIVLAVLGSGLWYKEINLSPENVFWGAINNNLASKSLTRHTKRTLGDQVSNTYIRFNTGSQNVAEILQIVTRASQPEYRVVQEKVGTPDIDYTRYKDINTGQSSKNYSTVEGVWGQSASSNVFNQAVQGTIPTAYLKINLRQQLVQAMQDKHIFSVDFTKVAREKVNGERVYVYDVKINPQPYFEIYKQFLNVLGLNKIELPDPETYANSKPLDLKIYIKPKARQISRIYYNTSRQEEFYSNSGLNKQVDIPDNSIPVSELQKRVQQIEAR